MAHDTPAAAHPCAPPPDPDRRPGPPKGTRSPLKIDISDELKADWKHRYEETAESAASIGRRAGFEQTYVRRLARREGWVRYVAPPRDVTPAARLAARVERLAAARQHGDAARAASPDSDDPADADASRSAPPLDCASRAPAQGDDRRVSDAEVDALVDDLLRESQRVLATVRTARQQCEAGGSANQAGLLARDLGSLTTAVQRLRHMRAPAPLEEIADGQDIDAVREELAQRIDALVDEWLHAETADGVSAPSDASAD